MEIPPYLRLEGKRKYAYIAIALFIVAAASSYRLFPTLSDAPPPLDAKIDRHYESGRYGISFLFPASYRLSQKELDTVGTIAHEIRLTPAPPVPPGSDGSPGIVISMYENHFAYPTAEDFIVNDDRSNYLLATSAPLPATYGNLSGVEFSWSGLYESKSFVVDRQGFVYVFSVEGANEDPELMADFRRVMDTVSVAM